MHRTVTLIVILAVILGCSTRKGMGHRLPDDVMPVLGCWFWRKAVFEPGGYKPFIDAVSKHSPYNLLTTSIRAPEVEVTQKSVYDQIKAAAEYAQGHGVPMVMDLDVRLARRAFESEYPDELQEMLLLEEVDLSPEKNVETAVNSHDLSDHYTYNTTHYIPLAGSLSRVYAYDRDAKGIDPRTLKDITDECEVLSANRDSVHVRMPSNARSKACVLVSFTHLTPDVFAPHLIEFQRRIITQYSDVPLAGVCKDEWGFPPCFDGNPQKNQFWYSKHRALAYRERTNGRDLLADCLLMHLGIKGQEQQRKMAINHFMDMSYQRNSELEDDFYRCVKEVYGANAVVATHPTWWPYPDLREFKKNGLDWWASTRDWAQTDEHTPFAVRTALAKKWGSPVWYNMFYSKEIADYERSVWSAALAGGRINYHQPYPVENPQYPRVELLRGNLMRAESRIRLLNCISDSPLDCPVAVIFGHTCAMNWAGPGYNDVGMDVVDCLWSRGHPTDLIPSSEIANRSLYLDRENWIRYGKQRYSAVILYHPEFEEPATAEFFQKAANGPTRSFRVGDWTQDFGGHSFDGNAALPENMVESTDIESIVSEIITALQSQNIAPQTPATSQLVGFVPRSSSPPTTGFCRLIDGTMIHVAGTQNVKGDPIQRTIGVGDHEVNVDAIGLAAIRLDDAGKVRALAAGGLAYFRTADFEIKLDCRADIAFWVDEDGHWSGVLQGWQGALPAQLLNITKDWICIDVPVPLSEY